MHANSDPAHREVDELMRRSRDAFLEGGCELEAARTLVAWGQVGLQRHDPDARDRLNQALRIFRDADLTWEVEFVRGLMEAPAAPA